MKIVFENPFSGKTYFYTIASRARIDAQKETERLRVVLVDVQRETAKLKVLLNSEGEDPKNRYL